jgi:hypothetical protein
MARPKDALTALDNTQPTAKQAIKQGPAMQLSRQSKKAKQDDGLPRSALGHAVRDDVQRAIKQAAAAQGRRAKELTEEALLEYIENHSLTKYLED